MVEIIIIPKTFLISQIRQELSTNDAKKSQLGLITNVIYGKNSDEKNIEFTKFRAIPEIMPEVIKNRSEKLSKIKNANIIAQKRIYKPIVFVKNTKKKENDIKLPDSSGPLKIVEVTTRAIP